MKIREKVSESNHSSNLSQNGDAEHAVKQLRGYSQVLSPKACRRQAQQNIHKMKSWKYEGHLKRRRTN
jgi:hypothetical protein